MQQIALKHMEPGMLYCLYEEDWHESRYRLVAVEEDGAYLAEHYQEWDFDEQCWSPHLGRDSQRKSRVVYVYGIDRTNLPEKEG